MILFPPFLESSHAWAPSLASPPSSRARCGRDQNHQGLRVPPSFSALAGGSVPEDEAALRGHAHRPQMAPDSSPLPQAVGAGAGAGPGGEAAGDGETGGEGLGWGRCGQGSTVGWAETEGRRMKDFGSRDGAGLWGRMSV